MPYEKHPLENKLSTIAQSLGWQCVGEPQFGWHKKSIGAKVKNHQGKVAWIKWVINPSKKEYDHTQKSSEIPLSFKPNIISLHLIEQSFVMIMDDVDEPVLGRSPWVLKDPKCISISFLRSLKQNLKSLSKHPTTTVHSRFDLIKRRVFERWNLVIKDQDCHFETVHGDLHWANMTKNYILDWEGFGKGLVGLDVATLIAFSGLYPDIVCNIKDLLCADFDKKYLALATLFITAELLRMHDVYNDHPELVPSLHALGTTSKAIYLA